MPSSVTVDSFGRSAAGRPVLRYSFANETGMAVSAIQYGATLTAVRVPDRSGKVANVVLSLPDMAAYERTRRRWAGVIGRYAGRIADAEFKLDGRLHRLSPGANRVTLHGGPDAFDRRIWSATPFSNSHSTGVTFSLSSPDGDQGFPGTVMLEVTYSLANRRNELRVEYRAQSDAPTVINLTNHGFFNLAGAGSRTIGGHVVTIPATRYVATDARKVPTGEMPVVNGTALDFRKPVALGPLLRMRDPLLIASNGLDHSLMLANPAGQLALAASVDEPVSGRRLKIFTTEPSILINSGGGFDGSEIGSEGLAYPRQSGLALETQHLPDSPNRPEFPSTVLRPGKPFRSVTTYRFSTF